MNLQIAKQYLAAGLSFVPVVDKKPLVKWSEYRTRQPTLNEITRWSTRASGIALICGEVSGNLEVIDIDAPECVYDFTTSSLPMARTPSGGLHIYYRCSEIAGNRILARDDDKSVRIETRGEGGMVTVCPTPGYTMLSGTLTDIPNITPQHRKNLHDFARKFNRYMPPEPVHVYTGPSTPTGDRPGDLFNASAEWVEILGNHGWKLARIRHDGTQEWQRPGKDDDGISATVGHNGHDTLYVFSSNAAPFEPDRGYSKFTAYALLEHNGDQASAAKWLAAVLRANDKVTI